MCTRLTILGLEMDLSVIVLSAYGDTELVMNGISHGACDFLVKPVRLEELKNIWQHVIRKKKKSEDQFVWSVELHRKFVAAVNQLGVDITTTSEAITALTMLQENKDKFDLVIADMHMPDMDGLELLELVGLEMDLPEFPVILLSEYSDTVLVSKAISQGACDILVKPVRLEELKIIWQHVLRQKSQFVWSVEPHRNFLAAVDQLGIDKAVPEKILDLMNVENITREDVASHLEKYRLNMKKISSVEYQQASMVAALGSADQDEDSDEDKENGCDDDEDPSA